MKNEFRLNVAFIDDEQNILNTLRRFIRKLPQCEAHFTSDPHELFRWIREKPFALVVSDQRMPVLEGAEVLKEVRSISPFTIRVMLTGYADIKAAIKAVNEGNIFRFLTKPWNEEELRSTVEQGLEQYLLVQENIRLQELTRLQNEELKSWNADLEKKVIERTKEISELNSELQGTLLGAIKLMSSLSGLSKHYVAGRAARIAKIAGLVGKALNLGERELFEVQTAAFLHDIGNITAFLGNPAFGEGTSAQVKFAAQMVSMIPNLGKTPLYILHQDEKHEGGGFPDGLKMSDIPLGSRIVALVKNYEELLHGAGGVLLRSTPERALRILEADGGKKFDPFLVKVLRDVISKRVDVSQEENEILIEIFELSSGMVLSRPLMTKSGEILLSEGFELHDEILELLWQRQINGQVLAPIYVFRKNLDGQKIA